jgi:hypothetical protein
MRVRRVAARSLSGACLAVAPDDESGRLHCEESVREGRWSWRGRTGCTTWGDRNW